MSVLPRILAGNKNGFPQLARAGCGQGRQRGRGALVAVRGCLRPPVRLLHGRHGGRPVYGRRRMRGSRHLCDIARAPRARPARVPRHAPREERRPRMKRTGRAARRGPRAAARTAAMSGMLAVRYSPPAPHRPPGAQGTAPPPATALPDLPVPFPLGTAPGDRWGDGAPARPGEGGQAHPANRRHADHGTAAAAVVRPGQPALREVSAATRLTVSASRRAHRDQRRMAGGHPPARPAGRPTAADSDHLGHGAIGDRLLARRGRYSPPLASRSRSPRARAPSCARHRRPGQRSPVPAPRPGRRPGRARATQPGRPGHPGAGRPGPAPGDLRAGSGPARRPGDRAGHREGRRAVRQRHTRRVARSCPRAG